MTSDLVFLRPLGLRLSADTQSLAHDLDLVVELSRPGTIVLVDHVVHAGAVLDGDHPDAGAQTVVRLLERAAQRSDMEATVLQTVGPKGYDAIGRMTELITPDPGTGAKTHYIEYDGNNNITKTTDFKGTSHYYQYDSLKRLTSAITTDTTSKKGSEVPSGKIAGNKIANVEYNQAALVPSVIKVFIFAERCLNAAHAPVKKSLPDQNITGNVNKAVAPHNNRRVSILRSRKNGTNW